MVEENWLCFVTAWSAHFPPCMYNPEVHCRVVGRQPTKLEKEASRRAPTGTDRSTAVATFDCQTLIPPPRRSNAAASIPSGQLGLLPRTTSVKLPTCWTPRWSPMPILRRHRRGVPGNELHSCPTKAPTIRRGRRRVAQAALIPCGSSEKRCVSTDCPSYIPLSAAPVTYRLPRKGARCCPDLSLRITQTLGSVWGG